MPKNALPNKPEVLSEEEVFERNTKPLTQEQKSIAEPFLGTFDNLCLMSTFMPKLGKYVATLCAYRFEADGSLYTGPVAILVDSNMMEELKDPQGHFPTPEGR